MPSKCDIGQAFFGPQRLFFVVVASVSGWPLQSPNIWPPLEWPFRFSSEQWCTRFFIYHAKTHKMVNTQMFRPASSLHKSFLPFIVCQQLSVNNTCPSIQNNTQIQEAFIPMSHRSCGVSWGSMHIAGHFNNISPPQVSWLYVPTAIKTYLVHLGTEYAMDSDIIFRSCPSSEQVNRFLNRNEIKT